MLASKQVYWDTHFLSLKIWRN